MKKLFLLLFLISFSLYAGDKDWERFHKVKPYNPHAVWQRVPCKKCNGTGSETVTEYDHKRNKTFKYQKPCVRCKGRGYIGMSKK